MSVPTIPPDGSRGLGPGSDLARAQRDRIMDALAATVAELGYQRTTIRTVVARARVSSTTYYDLFEDKEDCFLATVDQRVDRLIATIVGACRAEPDPTQRFRRGLEAFLGLCAREPHTAHLCVVELGAAGPAARVRRADMMERLSELAGRALSGMRPAAQGTSLSPLTSTIVVGGIHHLVQDRIAKGDTQSLPSLGPEILRLVLPAFESP